MIAVRGQVLDVNSVDIIWEWNLHDNMATRATSKRQEAVQRLRDHFRKKTFDWNDPASELLLKRALLRANSELTKWDESELSNYKHNKTPEERSLADWRQLVSNRNNGRYNRLLNELNRAGPQEATPEVTIVPSVTPPALGENIVAREAHPTQEEIDEIFGKSDDEGTSSDIPPSTSLDPALLMDSDEEGQGSPDAETVVRKRTPKAYKAFGDFNRPMGKVPKKSVSVSWNLTMNVPLGLVRVEFNRREIVFINPATNKRIRLPIQKRQRNPREVYDLTDLGGSGDTER